MRYKRQTKNPFPVCTGTGSCKQGVAPWEVLPIFIGTDYMAIKKQIIDRNINNSFEIVKIS